MKGRGREGRERGMKLLRGDGDDEGDGAGEGEGGVVKGNDENDLGNRNESSSW